MEMDDNAKAHAHLKDLLLQQIEIHSKQIEVQEKVSVRYKKILKRITVISILLSIAILGGICFIIYSVSKPESKINSLMKQVHGLEIRTSLQREYIDMDKSTLDSIQDKLNKLSNGKK